VGRALLGRPGAAVRRAATAGVGRITQGIGEQTSNELLRYLLAGGDDLPQALAALQAFGARPVSVRTLPSREAGRFAGLLTR
jgi:hypothetical protein